MKFLAELQHSSFNALSLFNLNPEIKTIPFGLNFIYAFIILSAWGLIYFIPGLLWLGALYKNFLNESPFGIIFKSFLVNFLLLVISISLFKLITHQELNRINFLIIIFWLIIIGLGLLWRKDTPLVFFQESLTKINKNIFFTVSLGVILIILLMFIFREKIFIENFSEGGIEVFYPALSLKNHLLPYADLEANGRFGLPISEPFLVISFLNLFNVLMFGASEVAVRLHFFLYLFMLYFIANKFLGIQRKFNTLCLSCFIVFLSIILFFYVDHNAYFEDIAKFACVLLFTVFLYLSIYFLLKKDTFFFLTVAPLSVLTLWSGLVLLPIILIGYRIYFKEEKEYFRQILLGYIFLIFILGISYIVFGAIKNYLGAWYYSLKIEYLNEMFFSPNKLQYIVVFLMYFVIMIGILPVLTLFMFKYRERQVCFFSFITLVYLLVVLKSSYINLDYFAPIVLLPLISFLRLTSYMRNVTSFIAKVLLFLVICFCTFISLPKRYIVHTAYREIGKKICMVFSSFEEAYRHRDICSLNYIDNMHFIHYIDVETIPYYADITLEPEKDYDYYITDNQNLSYAGLILLARKDDTYLFTRDLHNHVLLNSKYYSYPSREEIAADLFKPLFKLNRNYDDKQKGYFYY
jgi:hypothetical protein